MGDYLPGPHDEPKTHETKLSDRIPREGDLEYEAAEIYDLPMEYSSEYGV